MGKKSININFSRTIDDSRGYLMKLYSQSKNYIDLEFFDQNPRDLLLIFPGGGYHRTSTREAEPIRDVFRSEGYHMGIFYYREEHLLYPSLKTEGLEFLEMLKNHPLIQNIYLLGGSAGGHYAAMLSIYYSHLVDKTILLYPVISADPKYIHQGSYEKILGQNADPKLIKEISLENHVHDHMKPIFIFHTMDDQSVPVENSLILIQKLRDKQIPVEAHLYPSGRHGVSLATKEVSFEDMNPEEFVQNYGHLNSWVDLAKSFLRRIKP
jgi:acetyl esterase/lipase